MEKTDLKEIKKGSVGHGLLIENDGYVTLKDDNNKYIKEDIEANGWHVPNPFVVNCVLQKYGVKNANGRIYPENILKREVEKYQTRIMEKRALGELDHPAESTISLRTISHNIIEMHWEGRTLVGKLELNLSEGFRKLGVVSTMGDQAANLLLNGYKIGISSRAVGSVENKLGVLMVGNDLELLCWDLVSDPSTPNAWLSDSEEKLQPYIESNETVNGKNKLMEKINRIKKVLG